MLQSSNRRDTLHSIRDIMIHSQIANNLVVAGRQNLIYHYALDSYVSWKKNLNLIFLNFAITNCQEP